MLDNCQTYVGKGSFKPIDQQIYAYSDRGKLWKKIGTKIVFEKGHSRSSISHVASKYYVSYKSDQVEQGAGTF